MAVVVWVLQLSEEFCLWVLLFKGSMMSAMTGKKKGLLVFGHWVLIFALHSLVRSWVMVCVCVFGAISNCNGCACQRSYVVYPPEGPLPRTGDEIRDMIKKNKASS